MMWWETVWLRSQGAIITGEHSWEWAIRRPPAVPKNDRRNRMATENLAGGGAEGAPVRPDLELRDSPPQPAGCEQGKIPNGVWEISPESVLATDSDDRVSGRE
jgi:hypothetical protein